MSSIEATADLHVEARQQGDVVDGKHVGRVRHGQQQRALVDVGDRHGAVPFGGRHAEQVRRRHVDLEHAEIEVVETVALGDRMRELLGGDRAVFEEHALGRHAALAGILDRALDTFAVGRAQLDEDVGEEAARPTATAGSGDAGGLLFAGPLGGVRWIDRAEVGTVGHVSLRAARIACTGGACPVKRSKASVPWPSSTSRPSTT